MKVGEITELCGVEYVAVIDDNMDCANCSLYKSNFFATGKCQDMFCHGRDIILVELEKHSKVKGGSTPEQYSFPAESKELQDLIEYRNMIFAVGNIFKACYRLGQKDGVSEEYDLNKIIFFAKRELERIKK